jgi:hypothetical protein
MQKFVKAGTSFGLYTGTAIAIMGIVLLGLGTWTLLDSGLRTAIFVAGFVACLYGFFLICRDLLLDLGCPREARLKSEGNFPGAFHLNGFFVKAYEQPGKNGSKQFRLVSWPRFSPEREAACIRYIVHEGLIEEFWPHMSEKIKLEANWAFLR